MFTFTDRELDKLAKAKMTYENWQKFVTAFNAHTEFPACYKLVKASNKEDFLASLSLIAAADVILNKGRDLSAVKSLVDFSIEVVKNGGATIYEYLVQFPSLMLS